MQDNLYTLLPGKIYQVTDMANFLLADHVRKKLKTCLNDVGINQEWQLHSSQAMLL
jgi:hypothetical protein